MAEVFSVFVALDLKVKMRRETRSCLQSIMSADHSSHDQVKKRCHTS